MEVRIARDVLLSARVVQNLGPSVREAALRLRIPEEQLLALENGSAFVNLTLTMLNRFASAYRMSVNYFFLDEPLPPRKLPSYRTVGSHAATVGFDTAVSIRLVQQLQDNLTDIVEEREVEQLHRTFPQPTRQDPIEEIAERERDRLEVPVTEQLAWDNDLEAFRHWRWRIDRQGVFVYLEKNSLRWTMFVGLAYLMMMYCLPSSSMTKSQRTEPERSLCSTNKHIFYCGNPAYQMRAARTVWSGFVIVLRRPC
jgi:transcriptional regulator with XRE-family HTH domain